MAAPTLTPNRCVRFRYKYSACDRCVQACPHQAIKTHDAGVTIDPQACKGCALCVSSCSTQALALAEFEPIAVLREAIRKPSFAVACAPSGQPGDATVPCLGALDAAWLAYMARRGLAVSLRGGSHCAACEHGARGAAQLERTLDAVLTLHAAVTEKAAPDAPVWCLPSEENRPSAQWERALTAIKNKASTARRGFLQKLLRPRGEGPALTVQGADSGETGAIRAGPYLVSESRELLQIVCRQDAPVELVWHEQLPLIELTLQAGCTVCEACFRVCPSAAIGITESPTQWALTFDRDRCVGCMVCLEVCQPKVLDAQATFDPRPGREPVTLLARVKQRCKRCDRHFVSAQPQATCPVCSDDEAAFDLIFGPD